ncbi:MAG: class I SAM-dependent methyltransferase [Actinocatenispora sp.]
MTVKGRVSAAIAEGMAADVTGWNLDRFGDRMTTTSPPWDYRELVDGAVSAAPGSLLDMGTGGGEWLADWLSSRRDAPCSRVVATESWPANVPVAAGRLAPLGVTVLRTDGALDNVDQGPSDRSGLLPFQAGSFDVVINRHESYRAREIRRILRPGGLFVTQQVVAGEEDLHRLLDLPVPQECRWTLRYAVDQAAEGGLTVLDAGVGTDLTTYHDVAPLVWYLRQVPWAVPGFDPKRDVERLRAVQERIDRFGPVPVRRSYFWLRATRRSS